MGKPASTHCARPCRRPSPSSSPPPGDFSPITVPLKTDDDDDEDEEEEMTTKELDMRVAHFKFCGFMSLRVASLMLAVMWAASDGVVLALIYLFFDSDKDPLRLKHLRIFFYLVTAVDIVLSTFMFFGTLVRAGYLMCTWMLSRPVVGLTACTMLTLYLVYDGRWFVVWPVILGLIALLALLSHWLLCAYRYYVHVSGEEAGALSTKAPQKRKSIRRRSAARSQHHSLRVPRHSLLITSISDLRRASTES